MKNGIRASIVGLLVLGLLAAQKKEKDFSGRIWYRHSFPEADSDERAKLAAYFGAGQWTYITSGMYKTCDEQQQLKQLYTSATNQFQLFQEGRLTSTLDAGKKISTSVKLTPLALTDTILGYPCKALQIEEDGITTVYFYAPRLRVQPESYRKHILGEWYSYMKAANGGLTLKYIITDPKHHFRMVSEATAVEPLALSPADFTSDFSTH